MQVEVVDTIYIRAKDRHAFPGEVVDLEQSIADRLINMGVVKAVAIPTEASVPPMPEEAQATNVAAPEPTPDDTEQYKAVQPDAAVTEEAT